MNVPVGTPQQRASAINNMAALQQQMLHQQQQQQQQHPYAHAMPGTYDYGREMGDDPYMMAPHQQQQLQQQYSRASPMVSSLGAAPPAISNIRAKAGDVGVSRGTAYQHPVQQVQEDDLPKSKKESLLIRILTCRCG
jgi:casein kinase 1